MADTIFTSQTPTGSLSSGGSSSNNGVRWQLTGANKVVRGGRVWVPAGGIPSGSLWQVWDLVTFETIVTRSLNDATGSDTWFTFADITPTALVNGRFYYASRYSPTSTHDIPRTAGGTYPVGAGAAVANAGVERAGGGSGDLPDTIYAGYYFVDVSVADATVSGTGTATVGALTGTSSGLRKVFATGVSTLGALTGVSSGLRKVPAVGAATVGALTGAGAGGRKVYGVGTATVGALSAAGFVAAGAQLTGNGWNGLLSILQEGRDLYAQQKAMAPVACPSDGQPLQSGPQGDSHCSFCGWLASRGW